jgi:peptidyl-prolyl cis-trans isomerase D
MLRFLRKYSQGTVIKVLYGFLAVLFVIWGIGVVGYERTDLVATVYGEPITQRQVDVTTESLRRRYEELFRNAPTPPSLDLRTQALDELVEDALVRHEARRFGLEVSDAELVAAIMAMPELQEDGRFSRDLLEQALRVNRDRGEFEDQLRSSLRLQRLRSLLTDGVHVSDGETEARYQLDHERVNLAFVRIAAAPLRESITPTDADLEKHLANHPDRYQVPTRVRARYAVYKPADFAAQISVSDEAIAGHYDLHRADRFTEPEQVKARHILIKMAGSADEQAKAEIRKRAEDLLARAKAGEDFAALAKKHSEDLGSAANGGDLGLFPRGRMVPEFETAAFALQAGGLSDIVESQFGLHIIKVEERRAGGPRPLDGVRDEIEMTLRTQQGLDLARKQAEADRRAVVGGKSLAEAVQGRPLNETAPFAAGDLVAGIGRVRPFTDAAFALGEGEVSDLVETDDAVYLLSPFARTEAHTPTLADVRSRVEDDVRRERAEAVAKEKAEALRARAQAVGLDAAAAEAGYRVEQTGSFERRAGTIPQLGAAADLRSDAFMLTAAAPNGPRVYTVSGDAVVVALRERQAADMGGFASARDALRDNLLQQKRVAVVAAFMKMLKERAQAEGALEFRSEKLGPG